jgi:hypothetical protein
MFKKLNSDPLSQAAMQSLQFLSYEAQLRISNETSQLQTNAVAN